MWILVYCFHRIYDWRQIWQKKTKDLNLDWTIDETRNYFLEETKHNDLMSENHKKVCKTLS